MIFDQHDVSKVVFKELVAKIDEMLLKNCNIANVTGNAFDDGKLVGRWEGIFHVRQMLRSEYEKIKNATKEEKRDD